MTSNDDDSLDQEIAKYEQEDIVEAQKLLEQLLKTSRLNTTTFNKLLFGLIDTYAAKPDNYEHKEERTNKSYQQVMTFCADRLTMLNKPRATSKLLKEVITQYSSRNEYVKEDNNRRINEYISVGEHQFSNYKAEYEQGYTARFQQAEEALSYYSADMIKQKQKKLTSYVNGITNELVNDKLGNVLSRADGETVKAAIQIIDNIKRTVIDIKEAKKRKEVAREQQEKSMELACKRAVADINFIRYSTVDLLNLAIHYTKTPSHFQSHQVYMLDTTYLLQEVRKQDTKKIDRFRDNLTRALNCGLTYAIKKLSFNYEYGGDYTKKMAPKEAVIKYLEDWKKTNYEKINKDFEEDFTRVKSISLMSDIVKNGVKP